MPHNCLPLLADLRVEGRASSGENSQSSFFPSFRNSDAHIKKAADFHKAYSLCSFLYVDFYGVSKSASTTCNSRQFGEFVHLPLYRFFLNLRELSLKLSIGLSFDVVFKPPPSMSLKSTRLFP